MRPLGLGPVQPGSFCLTVHSMSIASQKSFFLLCPLSKTCFDGPSVFIRGVAVTNVTFISAVGRWGGVDLSAAVRPGPQHP